MIFRAQLLQMSENMHGRLEANRLSLDEAAKFLREESAKQMGALREENSAKLEQMRKTVDEQLQARFKSAWAKVSNLS